MQLGSFEVPSGVMKGIITTEAIPWEEMLLSKAMK